MSEAGYTEIDLDAPASKAKPGAPADELEIVDVASEEPVAQPDVEPATPAPKPAPARASEEDDEPDTEADAEGRKRLTRSQRLKLQRDANAAKLAEKERELDEIKKRLATFEDSASEAAAISVDLYIQNIDSTIKGLRREFDAAMDNGDRDKLWEVQQKIAELTAEKNTAQREKRSIPTKAAPAKSESGQDARQPTQPTTQPAGKRPAPAPLVQAWYEDNKEWFDKDVTMRAVTAALDQQLLQEGYSVEEPEYFEELDKRLRAEMPHKFPSTKPKTSPTISNRATTPTANGKVRVQITPADREMANHLGISIEAYARQKARREAAMNTATQYTEIM